jgi:glycosyltransferase involved in cell wall biosynthesis
LNERIAVLTTSYPRAPADAAGHFVASEVRRLRARGHEVQVFAPGPRALASSQASVHWLGDHGAFGWPGALPRLRENPLRALGAAEFALRARQALLAAGPFSRLQAHFLVPSGWPIALLGLENRARSELELVGHGSDVRLFCRLPKPLRKQIASAWLARGAQLRLTSEELAHLLVGQHPELRAVVRVEASPIDVEGIPDRSTARRRLGLSETSAVAIVVARLIPEKRVDVALRALSAFAVSVIVVGDGPDLELLRADFPKVRFTGRLPRDQALCCIAAADVLVSASREEGAPTVVREARLLGVPVVALAAGDLEKWARQDPGILLART